MAKRFGIIFVLLIVLNLICIAVNFSIIIAYIVYQKGLCETYLHNRPGIFLLAYSICQLFINILIGCTYRSKKKSWAIAHFALNIIGVLFALVWLIYPVIFKN
ncbi:hypothetical protein HZS_6451, partial [Henneguya salminicola]